MTTTAFLVIGFVLVLLIGNFMGAKPNEKEMQLDSVRMSARKLELLPRLVAVPDWLHAKDKGVPKANKDYYDYTKDTDKMIGQYTVINNDWQLPKAQFLIENNSLLLLENNNQEIARTYLERQSKKLSDNAKVLNHAVLDEQLKEFLPFLRGVLIQANSVSLFWYDEKWASGLSKRLNGNLAKGDDKFSALNAFAEQELLLLKQTMIGWAEQVARAKQ